MGLIRKSLAISSVGLVSGSSKKQRAAKATQKGTAATNKILTEQAALLAQQASAEAEYRYVTDPIWRAHVDKQRAAAAEQARLHMEQQALKTRLRKERQAVQMHKVGVRVSQAIAIPVLAIVFLLVASWVWMPQVLVAKVQHRSGPLWKRAEIRSRWAEVLHAK